jgi:class 3 adenylate cyclase
MTLETVTLLFTDLVGSTELANRIGPGPADVLRREHFGLLGDAAGTARGRQVKNLGDGLMLVFPSVNGALDAAVAMQRAIEARNRSAEVRFQVRVGVAVGEVTAEDGDYFGEPVVQAARLCALAEGGQILVTDTVRLLAGSAGGHQLSPMGPMELKGLPEPVVAHEVGWAPSVGAALSLPMRLRGAPDAAYVGRADERERLHAAWAGTAGGQGSLVLLSGEPGIGKTRLSSQHAFDVHGAGGTVLYGAVDEGLGVPYQPWIEALSHYVEHAPEALLRRFVAEAGADLVRLVPLLERRVPDLPPLSRSDGETERYVLLDAATRLLRMAAANNPVLVVLDDLHWADKQTLLLLAHLHRELVDSRVEFLVTFRDSDLTPEHPLTDTLATLRRADRVERIALSGLRRDEIGDLLVKVSGQATTEALTELAGMLERDTNGNPLFVGEVLRDLLEGGHVAQDDQGVWGLATSLDELRAPASVRDVVAQRVQRLGADAAQVLGTAAVIGRDFELDLLAAVLDRSADDLLTVVESAMAASLVTESGARAGSFRFIHALIAQALIDDQSLTRRGQLHRRIATVIQQLHGPDLRDRVATVARHVLEAGDDVAKSVDWARRAGQQALASLAPDEALRWFRAALELGVEDPLTHCDLLTEVGEAMRDAGEPGSREVLLAAAHEAEALADEHRAARAALAMNRWIPASVGTTDHELVGAIEMALALCSNPDPRRARLLAQLALERLLVAPLEERRQLVDEALDIARGIDDECLASVLLSSLTALWTSPLVVERRLLLAELDELLPRVPDPQVRALAAIHGVYASLEVGDRPAVDRSLAAARAACGPGAQPSTRWFLSMVECVVAGIDGHCDEAERHAATGFEEATSAGLKDAWALYSGQLLGVYCVQGRLGELVETIERIFAENPLVSSGIRPTLAAALSGAGRLEEARGVLSDVVAEELPTWIENMLWSAAVNQAAFAAHRTGDVAAARELYALALRAEGSVSVLAVSCAAVFPTTLGMLAVTLGDRSAALEHFAAGNRLLHGPVAPALLAINRYEHARALVDLGDPADHDEARQLLHDAAAFCSAHQMEVRVTQCAELLASIG